MTNAAVIGGGYWGPNLIRNFGQLPNCKVKWACDIDAKRLEHIKQIYPNIETTTNVERLLEDPDVQAIAIATPVATHFKLAEQSLTAGKHTFIEKPMARTSAECEKLIDIADKESLILMIGHTFIYNPAVRKMKELIKSGVIGDILCLSARRLNLGLFQNDINVAWDLAPHDLAIILYLLDESPTSLNCQGKAHLAPGIEDVTNLSLYFNNGVFATVHSSWIDPNKVRQMTVVGTKGMIVYDDTEPLEKLKIYDKHVEVPPHYNGFGDFQFSYHYGGTHSPYIEQEEPLKIQTRHFIDCIEKSERPQTGGLEGLEIIRILEAASKSLQNDGSAVQLKPRA